MADSKKKEGKKNMQKFEYLENGELFNMKQKTFFIVSEGL